MTEHEAWDLLVSTRVAVLGTNRNQGPPRLVPFTFAPLGERTLVSAVDAKPKRHRRLARLADIERDPRVTVLAHAYDDDWSRLWWVRGDGRAGIRGTPPPGSEALVDRYPQYTGSPPNGPWLVIVLETLVGWRSVGPE